VQCAAPNGWRSPCLPIAADLRKLHAIIMGAPVSADHCTLRGSVKLRPALDGDIIFLDLPTVVGGYRVGFYGRV
jgi:hypothetical protein